MKMILPMLAVFCFALAGVGCNSTCATGCSHDHGAKCCGTCAAEKKCCGKCSKEKAKCCGKCDKPK